MAEQCSKCSATLEKHCTRGCSQCTSGYRCPRHGRDWAYRTGGDFFSSGSPGAGSKCRKCSRATANCRWCKGQAGKTCKTCGGTGQTCPDHGRYWK
jgi:hypothetical protein